MTDAFCGKLKEEMLLFLLRSLEEGTLKLGE